MAELAFRKDGVVYRTTVETPFGREVVEKKADYDKIRV